jgi:homoserine dehydrogenase
MAKIAIMGFGTVGSGVLEVLETNKISIAEKCSDTITVKYILDIRDFSEDPHHELFTKNFEDILNDEEVSVVVETMGGLHPSYDFTKRLLLKGKHVVTSNKELVAAYGAELLQIAREKDINYMFEASVGGGIPIIRPLNSCLAANEITEIVGILNGTTNYILTEMFESGKEFSVALKDAQDKGYAEKNPAADVEGHDACRKIAILSSLVFGKRVDYTKINTDGITDITLTDVKYAEAYGSVIKLIGRAKIENDRVFASVEPTMLKTSHSLAGIKDVFNGILVKGNAIGDVMFYGRGAGKLPTASAVVADVIDCVRNLDRNNHYFWEEVDTDFVVPYDQNTAKFLVRIAGSYEEQKDRICNLFGETEVLQIKEGEFGIITSEMTVADLKEKMKQVSAIKKIKFID